ncbi:MAG: acyl-[acyl-carrier-protein]--UDP-N-acetylglucosamine O-acyltransferase [Gammaproteobacteria bacterium RIFCSPHIGHO2_12_FULL_42_10]|nr:MAG: acyl-[acyl-carrier-protein]--UDP-N-acetylglucosamine O-acyltransferase [Gammaproteobacteria bacterium RIFCSPHIGHO2_12_FULL_42_10]
MIHQTAIIDKTALIAKEVEIGPYSVIGPEVEIGEGTVIGPHVVIQGPTRIGCHNKIYQFASLGAASQDKKHTGQRAYLEVGDRNIIRECTTLNRGSKEGTLTKIGNDNLLMAYVHIAHDCIVGNNVVFANNASLAGHVIVEDYVILSGFSGVFQFCRIGAHSFATTNSVIIKDVPPFVKVAGYYAKPYGLNTVGLERLGYSADIVKRLRQAYKIIYRKKLTIVNALEELKQMNCEYVNKLVHFIEGSDAGIVR